MTIKKVIVNLERLFFSWGISPEDWILVAQYAYKLLGYKVSVRKGHLNIVVNKNKLPWDLGEALETHPPTKTKYHCQFVNFIRDTGFEFDIAPVEKEKFEGRLKTTTIIKISGSQINVQTAVGALKELDELLARCTPDGWGQEKGVRVLESVENQMAAIGEKGEKETAEKYQQLLKKYSHLKAPVKISQKIRFIKGTPASVGDVRGRARVILKPDTKTKLAKGEILVTTMTSPKFTHLIKNATAIITDEGGMLCHAAVLAREMGIPCIVGTKSATKFFKDGDLVRLDAKRGIAKKI